MNEPQIPPYGAPLPLKMGKPISATCEQKPDDPLMWIIEIVYEPATEDRP